MNRTARRSSTISAGRGCSRSISSCSNRSTLEMSSSPVSVTWSSSPSSAVSQLSSAIGAQDTNRPAPLLGAFPRIGSVVRAVAPGGGSTLPVELDRQAVLGRLGGLGRIAGATHRAPGLHVELVLAAVAAVGRHGPRIPARLALSDALQGGRHLDVRTAVAAAGGLRLDAQTQLRERGRAGDAVGLQAGALLKALDGLLGERAVVAAGRDAQLALEALDVRSARARLERHRGRRGAVAAAGVGARTAGAGDGGPAAQDHHGGGAGGHAAAAKGPTAGSACGRASLARRSQRRAVRIARVMHRSVVSHPGSRVSFRAYEVS